MTVNTITEAVATRLATSGNVVQERVVNVMVEKELAKREKQISDAYTEYDNLTKLGYRLEKPDQGGGFNRDGTLVQGTFSKGRLKEIEDLQKRKAKIEAAVEAALANNNFKLLNGLGAGPKFNVKPDTDAEGSTEESSS